MILITNILKKIAIRSVLIFLVLHAGLICGVIGLTQLAQESNLYGTTTWYLLLGGVIALYASMMMAAFFVLWPIYSLVRMVRKLMQWREWVLTDLPKLIAMIPSLIESLRKAFGQDAGSAGTSAANTSSQSSANEPAKTESSSSGAKITRI